MKATLIADTEPQRCPGRAHRQRQHHPEQRLGDDPRQHDEDQRQPHGVPEHRVVDHAVDVVEAGEPVVLRVGTEQLQVREAEVDGIADREQEEHADQHEGGHEPSGARQAEALLVLPGAESLRQRCHARGAHGCTSRGLVAQSFTS
jgi:hypothetical protein